MPSNLHNLRSGSRGQAGFSLIELMIAMILGLIVVAAAGGVFISNKRVYNAAETLGRIQENGRVAFELISRDIREAGGNPCGSNVPPTNILSGNADLYWNRFAQGITGYAPGQAVPLTGIGTGAGQRAAGTDAVEIHAAPGRGVQVVAHELPGDALRVTSVAGFVANDILLVCQVGRSFIFQATALANVGTQGTIAHTTGAGSLNCADSFQVYNGDGVGDADVECDATAPSAASNEDYCFTEPGVIGTACDFGSEAPAYVARLATMQWYVGNNDRGGTSLYRAIITNRTNTANPDTVLARDEIVEGVEDMELTYLEQGLDEYRAANLVADWNRVVAVRIVLDFEATEGALSEREIQGTDGQAISRTITHVVNLRNREGTL